MAGAGAEGRRDRRMAARRTPKVERTPCRGSLLSLPVSRILSGAAIHLPRCARRTAQRPCGLPGARRAASSPLLGLAPGGVCLAGASPRRRCALTAPFHPCRRRRRGGRARPPNRPPLGRCPFCGTFPRVSPGRRYRPPCPSVSGLSSRAGFLPGLPRLPGRQDRSYDAERASSSARGLPRAAAGSPLRARRPAAAPEAPRLPREPPQARCVAIVRRDGPGARVAARGEDGVERAAVGEPQVDERAPVPVAALLAQRSGRAPRRSIRRAKADASES